MTNNLLESFERLLTPDVIGRMASATGESEGAVSKALTATVPLMLSALSQRAGDGDKMHQIMGLLNSPEAVNGYSNLSNLLDPNQTKSPLMDMGRNFLSAIFGRQHDAVASALAQYSGIRNASAYALLSYAAPVVLALLADRVRKGGWSAGGLAGWIAGQHDVIASTAPSLLGAAGLGHLRDASSIEAATAKRVVTETRRSTRWLWPVAAAVILFLGGLWALLRSQPQTAVVRAPDVSRPGLAGDAPPPLRDVRPGVLDTADRMAADLGAFVKRQLPNNVELNIPTRGIESQVIVFIENTNQPLEPVQWFNFDRLVFETGSAVLKPESAEQLRNVAEIMKAYPTAEFRIGGYTDNVGNPSANLELSQDRAANVKAELVRLGIAPERLSAEGYGEQFPVADNSTEAGRAQNRRIGLRVTQR